MDQSTLDVGAINHHIWDQKPLFGG